MTLEEGDLVAIKEFYFTSPDKRTRSYAVVIEAGWRQSQIRVIHSGVIWWIPNNELKLLSGGSRSKIEKV
jgi:hypothetical protein